MSLVSVHAASTAALDQDWPGLAGEHGKHAFPKKHMEKNCYSLNLLITLFQMRQIYMSFDTGLGVIEFKSLCHIMTDSLVFCSGVAEEVLEFGRVWESKR